MGRQRSAPRLVEPIGQSFYTVLVDFDTLTSLFERLGSGSYNLYVVIAELVLIGLMVNWCAGVLHGTRGTRLLRGLLVVLVVATLVVRVLADQLGWIRLGLLYRYFIIGMAFIALVAFQPELRRALIRAGEMRFLQRAGPRGRLISALLEAAGYLSRNRYGALVAIQRDVGLTNWAEHGTQVNAEISANLLKTIFYPNSALHDLGVIIRGNRLLAAGCQFPVAESGELDPSLGSRHRAAVGLSSESDALVLVISEETGTISLADSGKLTRFLALDDLEEELESRLVDRFLTSGRTRRVGTASDAWRITRRLLVVVPLTLVIWFLADQASLISAAGPEGIPVHMRIAHAGSLHVDIHEPQPADFTLDVRGPRRAIEQLWAVTADQPFQVEWPLPDAYTRPGRVRLEGDQLRDVIASLPPVQERGVFVENVKPDRFEFAVDQVVSVRVPVRVAAGPLRVEDVRIDPEQVAVWLRQEDHARLSEAQLVIEADVQDLLKGKPLDKTVNLDRVALGLRLGDTDLLRVEPGTVNVRLTIVAERVPRRLEGVRVLLVVSPPVWQRYEIELADANEWLLELEVEGDRAVVDALRPEDVHALVSLTGDQPPSSEFRSAEVDIALPEGVTLKGPPRLVHYRLKAREGATP